MSYWVYVLVSESTARRYVGHTDDLHRRLIEHNSQDHNVRKFTSRNAGPWLLVYSEPFATRGEAMAREKWLKSGSGRRWLDELLGRVRRGGLTAKSKGLRRRRIVGELFRFLRNRR